MDAKTILNISEGSYPVVLVDRSTGEGYDRYELCQDTYGNSYMVLTRIDAPASSSAIAPASPLAGLHLVGNDVPVYVRDACEGMLGVKDASYEKSVVLFSTYIPRKTTPPVVERTSLVLMNAIQGVIFCFLGLIPILLGAGDAMILAQDTLRVDAIGAGFLVNVLGYIAAGTLFLLGLSGLQSLLMPKQSKEAFDKKQRQGATGELFQLPIGLSAIYFTITGISEEVLFRAGVLGTMMAISYALGIDIVASFIIALVASSIIFAAAHTGSYDLPALVVVFFYGAALGVMWMISGTILVPIVVHGLYDFLAGVISSRGMAKDPRKFFSGKRPNALLSSKRDGAKSENAYEIIF